MARPSLCPVEKRKNRKKSARKGLILRNTGFIITGTTVCMFVECIQVIEDFISWLMVFRGGICVGRVSGRRWHPKTEVFQCQPYISESFFCFCREIVLQGVLGQRPALRKRHRSLEKARQRLLRVCAYETFRGNHQRCVEEQRRARHPGVLLRFVRR